MKFTTVTAGAPLATISETPADVLVEQMIRYANATDTVQDCINRIQGIEYAYESLQMAKEVISDPNLQIGVVLSILNRGNVLAEDLGLSLPEADRLRSLTNDNVGYLKDEVSIAVENMIANAGKTIWENLKKLFAKVVEFVKMIFSITERKLIQCNKLADERFGSNGKFIDEAKFLTIQVKEVYTLKQLENAMVFAKGMESFYAEIGNGWGTWAKIKTKIGTMNVKEMENAVNTLFKPLMRPNKEVAGLGWVDDPDLSDDMVRDGRVTTVKFDRSVLKDGTVKELGYTLSSYIKCLYNVDAAFRNALKKADALYGVLESERKNLDRGNFLPGSVFNNVTVNNNRFNDESTITRTWRNGVTMTGNRVNITQKICMAALDTMLKIGNGAAGADTRKGAVNAKAAAEA